MLIEFDLLVLRQCPSFILYFFVLALISLLWDNCATFPLYWYIQFTSIYYCCICSQLCMNFVSACSVVISIILCAVHHYHCTSAYTIALPA